MPSTNKRINLTVTDEIYEKIQAYKEKNGVLNDASACLQLIVQQLKAQENTEAFLNIVRSLTPEQIRQLTEEGTNYTTELIKKLPE